MRVLRRRRPPTAGPPGDVADLERALAVANRRVVLLEMDKATLRNRLDRMAGQCAPPCPHKLRLEEAEFANLRMQTEHEDVYAGIRAAMDRIYRLSDPTAGNER